ncbi:helix-turn-helix transcriptional regulator [Bradyrhizobium sp.]|uniref:helix-turn-helix domain-containing protein n=1 Tax=Bradyrhizobium sp. TaxID=376 RepID=UPI002DDD01EA|nr:helix-turn-helix transcriptional regulator [Bradyrhizobium sp.]HEV2156352.1 helix-turn-helix transcriptional regulator [Bradyrhizobium sp.]
MADPIRTAPGFVAVFVDRARALGLSHREVDEIAGLGEGYFSKLACGDRRPTASTIEKLCGALHLAFLPCATGAAQMGVCESDEYSDHR